MALYVITAEGSWPINDMSPREPLAGEMFTVTRDGEPARSVIAHAPHSTLVALERDLVRDGVDEDEAKRRARAVFRLLGAEATRAFASTGSLRYRVDDTPLSVPVEMEAPHARRMAHSTNLRFYEQGHSIGDAFEVDD